MLPCARSTGRTPRADVIFPKINLSQPLRKHPRGERWGPAAAPLPRVNARNPTWISPRAHGGAHTNTLQMLTERQAAINQRRRVGVNR